MELKPYTIFYITYFIILYFIFYVRKKNLGLLFFINWFTDIFTADLGTGGKIKIKYKTST